MLPSYQILGHTPQDILPQNDLFLSVCAEPPSLHPVARTSMAVVAAVAHVLLVDDHGVMAVMAVMLPVAAVMPAARAAHGLLFLTKKLVYVIQRKTSAKDYFGKLPRIDTQVWDVSMKAYLEEESWCVPICIYSVTNCWVLQWLCFSASFFTCGSFIPQRNSLKIWNVYNPQTVLLCGLPKGSQNSHTVYYKKLLNVYFLQLPCNQIWYAASLHSDFFRN